MFRASVTWHRVLGCIRKLPNGNVRFETIRQHKFLRHCFNLIHRQEPLEMSEHPTGQSISIWQGLNLTEISVPKCFAPTAAIFTGGVRGIETPTDRPCRGEAFGGQRRQCTEMLISKCFAQTHRNTPPIAPIHTYRVMSDHRCRAKHCDCSWVIPVS